jgi:molybdopterin converting factor small subunit
VLRRYGHLFDERGELRLLVNVYVNRTQVDGLDGLQADDEIRLLAAVVGG